MDSSSWTKQQFLLKHNEKLHANLSKFFDGVRREEFGGLHGVTIHDISLKKSVAERLFGEGTVQITENHIDYLSVRISNLVPFFRKKSPLELEIGTCRLTVREQDKSQPQSPAGPSLQPTPPAPTLPNDGSHHTLPEITEEESEILAEPIIPPGPQAYTFKDKILDGCTIRIKDLQLRVVPMSPNTSERHGVLLRVRNLSLKATDERFHVHDDDLSKTRDFSRGKAEVHAFRRGGAMIDISLYSIPTPTNEIPTPINEIPIISQSRATISLVMRRAQHNATDASLTIKDVEVAVEFGNKKHHTIPEIMMVDIESSKLEMMSTLFHSFNVLSARVFAPKSNDTAPAQRKPAALPRIILKLLVPYLRLHLLGCAPMNRPVSAASTPALSDSAGVRRNHLSAGVTEVYHSEFSGAVHIGEAPSVQRGGLRVDVRNLRIGVFLANNSNPSEKTIRIIIGSLSVKSCETDQTILAVGLSAFPEPATDFAGGQHAPGVSVYDIRDLDEEWSIHPDRRHAVIIPGKLSKPRRGIQFAATRKPCDAHTAHHPHHPHHPHHHDRPAPVHRTIEADAHIRALRFEVHPGLLADRTLQGVLCDAVRAVGCLTALRSQRGHTRTHVEIMEMAKSLDVTLGRGVAVFYPQTESSRNGRVGLATIGDSRVEIAVETCQQRRDGDLKCAGSSSPPKPSHRIDQRSLERLGLCDSTVQPGPQFQHSKHKSPQKGKVMRGVLKSVGNVVGKPFKLKSKPRPRMTSLSADVSSSPPADLHASSGDTISPHPTLQLRIRSFTKAIVASRFLQRSRLNRTSVDPETALVESFPTRNLALGLSRGRAMTACVKQFVIGSVPLTELAEARNRRYWRDERFDESASDCADVLMQRVEISTSRNPACPDCHAERPEPNLHCHIHDPTMVFDEANITLYHSHLMATRDLLSMLHQSFRETAHPPHSLPTVLGRPHIKVFRPVLYRRALVTTQAVAKGPPTNSPVVSAPPVMILPPNVRDHTSKETLLSSFHVSNRDLSSSSPFRQVLRLSLADLKFTLPQAPQHPTMVKLIMLAQKPSAPRQCSSSRVAQQPMAPGEERTRIPDSVQRTSMNKLETWFTYSDGKILRWDVRCNEIDLQLVEVGTLVHDMKRLHTRISQRNSHTTVTLDSLTCEQLVATLVALDLLNYSRLFKDSRMTGLKMLDMPPHELVRLGMDPLDAAFLQRMMARFQRDGVPRTMLERRMF